MWTSVEAVVSQGYDKEVDFHFLIFLTFLKISLWKDISQKEVMAYVKS